VEDARKRVAGFKGSNREILRLSMNDRTSLDSDNYCILFLLLR